VLNIYLRYGPLPNTAGLVSVSESEAMDPWTALEIFLVGAAIGALLTAIAYAGRIRQLRESLRTGLHDRQEPKEPDERKGAA
jgi:hypothetical protein